MSEVYLNGLYDPNTSQRQVDLRLVSKKNGAPGKQVRKYRSTHFSYCYQIRVLVKYKFYPEYES